MEGKYTGSRTFHVHVDLGFLLSKVGGTLL